MTLRECLRKTKFATIPPDPSPVERTVAEAIASELGLGGIHVADRTTVVSGPTIHVSVLPAQGGSDNDSMYFKVASSGAGQVTTSRDRWLYALKCLVFEEWADRDAREFSDGIRISPSFPWLRNLSDFFVGSLRGTRRFDREAYVRQIARQGFSHITINGLGVDRPFESGPPGDVYSWFYDYSPDLDQFVDSALLRGTYSREYLQANLSFLKENAALALRYGLTPGLHINSPRSMPEEFWSRYAFLRGARVDHPRESFRPRYTLAMAHPAVQQHYRELVRAVMGEVPEIGFIHVWTNDSGSGFEFVSTLYAGRNGGPYLIREWKNDEEIARKAGENVLTYFHLLRDEGRAINPDFRVVCDLGPFSKEIKYIVPSFGDGIDAGEFAFFEKNVSSEEKEALASSGAEVHQKLDLTDNTLPGLPFPRLVYDRLMQLKKSGVKMVLAGASPGSLAPFDVNGEVIRAVQLNKAVSLDLVLYQTALRWAGVEHARRLIEIWNLSDSAVRSFPAGVPMSTFAFPWFRLWVRPFVPDIDAIPEEERSYYERFLLATFNNPARIDLNNDMLWNFLSVTEAGEKKRQIDDGVLDPLGRAIALSRETLNELSSGVEHAEVFRDVLDRLRAARCFYGTMRNTMAWTESVHGYVSASRQGEKEEFRRLCRAMVENEISNARDLLTLWRESRMEFTPISAKGESLHTYGEDFGNHLERKIALMDRHKDDEPKIDPEYMWHFPVERPMKREMS